MRCLAWAVVCALVAAVPVVGRGDIPPLSGGPVGEGYPLPVGDANYKAPKADGPVVELLDEATDPLFPVLINDGGGEHGTITREDRDVFAGVEAVRVAPMQKYRTNIPGWKFRIVEAPKNAGEFRYLRLAWKKDGGEGLMIQFHDPQKSWAFRYHAGNNIYGWQPSTQVAAKPPAEWALVTRDLFKDYGAFTLTGMALSPLDGNSALFDHILLGRTIEDLDKATDTAQGRVKGAKAPAGKEREALWAELLGADRAKAAAAQRAFLATAADHAGFIGEQFGKSAPDKATFAKIQKLLKELDADDFDVRDTATDELVKLGAVAAEALRNLAASPPNAEVGYRANLVLRKLEGVGPPVNTAGRTVRAVRVLERAATPEARAVLEKMAGGEFGFDMAPDAKAALGRLKAKP